MNCHMKNKKILLGCLILGLFFFLPAFSMDCEAGSQMMITGQGFFSVKPK